MIFRSVAINSPALSFSDPGSDEEDETMDTDEPLDSANMVVIENSVDDKHKSEENQPSSNGTNGNYPYRNVSILFLPNLFNTFCITFFTVFRYVLITTIAITESTAK